MFEEWNYDRHVVPRPRRSAARVLGALVWHRLRPAWPLGRAWLAIDGDHRIWLYRGALPDGVRMPECKPGAIHGHGGRRRRRRTCAMSSTRRPPTTDNAGPSIYEMYGQEGLGCPEADNDRIGWLGARPPGAELMARFAVGTHTKRL